MQAHNVIALLALAAPVALAAQVPAPAPSPAPAQTPTPALPAPVPAAQPAPSAGSLFAPTVPAQPATPAMATYGVGPAWAQYAPSQGQSGWLGVGLSCEQCSVSRVTSSRSAWSFRALPVVLWVDAEGPAYAAGMRSGDTLTSVDGYDLLSPEGGRQFARIQPGQTVTLAYRRAGRERTVRITAVLRPEVRDNAEARQVMERYRVLQDSQMQAARAQLMQAQRELEVVNRALEQGNRAVLDSTRQQLLEVERSLRALQGTERDRFRGISFAYSVPSPAVDVMVPSVAPRVWSGSIAAVPLRYSGRLGDVNVEARGPGAVNVNEVADTLIVVSAGPYVVRIARRAPGESGRIILVRGLVMTDEGDALEGVTGSVLRGGAARRVGVATAFRVAAVQSGSRADGIGVQRGDVIVELNGHAVTRASARRDVESARSVVVMRDGQRVVLTAERR